MPKAPKYPKMSSGFLGDNDNVSPDIQFGQGQREEAYPKQGNYGYQLPLTDNEKFSEVENTSYATSHSVQTQLYGQSPPEIQYPIRSYQPGRPASQYEESLISTASYSASSNHHSPRSQHSHLGSSPPNSSSSHYGPLV